MKKINFAILIVLALALPQLAFFGKEEPQPVANAAKSSSDSGSKGDALKPADFGNMMNQLSANLMTWNSLSNANKTQAVDAVIQLYKNRENSAILKPADFYVQKIDEAIGANPAMANSNLINIVRIMAVMEYDFYNGKNKDDLAKEVLGDRMAQAVKMRRQFANGGGM